MLFASLAALAVLAVNGERLHSHQHPSLAIRTQALDSSTDDGRLFPMGGEHVHGPSHHGHHHHGHEHDQHHDHGHRHAHSRKILTEAVSQQASSTAGLCGIILPGRDFPHNDIPGSVITESAQLCANACEAIAYCNAMSWDLKTQRCYVKNIPDDYEAISLASFVSYRVCPAAVPVAAEVPVAADASPFGFDPRSNPHPSQDPHPLLPPAVDESSPPRSAADVLPLAQGAHAWYDYQMGGSYNPSLGTRVVSRDWYYAQPLFTEGSYSICYINAFQTLNDMGAENAVRPDVTSNWPAEVVMHSMEDPENPGEYVIDISTPAKREAALNHVAQMLTTCEDKLYAAVEFANLDTFVRYSDVPFTKDDAVEYATMLVSKAHSMGLAAAQQNTIELIDTGDYAGIGFDFAVVERCGENNECAAFRDAYDGRMVAVEYTQEGFESACHAISDIAAVVMRDAALSTPDYGSYEMQQCGP